MQDVVKCSIHMIQCSVHTGSGCGKFSIDLEALTNIMQCRIMCMVTY